MGPPVKDLTAAPASAAKGHLALPKSRLPLYTHFIFCLRTKQLATQLFHLFPPTPIYSLSSSASFWHLGGPILIIF